MKDDEESHEAAVAVSEKRQTLEVKEGDEKYMSEPVTARLIKELRDRTGVGMGKCKEALKKPKATSNWPSPTCANQAWPLP